MSDYASTNSLLEYAVLLDLFKGNRAHAFKSYPHVALAETLVLTFAWRKYNTQMRFGRCFNVLVSYDVTFGVH